MIKLYPKAQLITKPVFDLPGFDKFIEKETKLKPINSIDPQELLKPNHCDLIPMMAGKLCYLSFYSDKGRRKNDQYIASILESAHGSVLEHTNIGFILMTSRDISHEIVRHRIASYSQLSQRYVNYPQFLIPPELHSYFSTDGIGIETDNGPRYTPKYSALNKFIDNIIQCKDAYEVIINKLEDDFIDQKISKSDLRKIVQQTARAVLPNATVTYIFMTANIRSWRTILEARCSPYAATGIRWLFNQVFEQIKDACPNCFQDYTKVQMQDGSFSIKTDNKKV